MLYEALLAELDGQAVEVYEERMKQTIKGLYGENVIWINKSIPTTVEKACILAEELGHHFTTSGNIIDQQSIPNRKQEKLARSWAYNKLVPLSSIVQAHKKGIRNRHELAEYLGVTEDFLDSAINRYQEKHGISVSFGPYTICFEPLGVLEFFE
ncbi:ImmA/IrrE family metallo-endopeptidase [Brevibacillus choshinensis]|uniref:ImmA/IrrE family metallo-endopeptidase n=1 Tax=Brevibacillus choshinensis TaxID=54911 RepID=A0ABX7FYC9_BRECH|nr:ImmA/IrrE family metallo-endopeptidase [Brevibacillus choshinensis]QRG70794.1 ImmA/IrrE family metallo-endopeptidase [Brevibacillus choshinensis]